MESKLKKDFYNRNVLRVAEDLLGKIFVVNDKENMTELRGRIVEVEAYDGKYDEAAHTFNGKTERNEVMFRLGGHLYVYFTYGIHFCANVVTGKVDEGSAVLLRAMEPLKGTDLFALRRFGTSQIDEKDRINLLNGPAKICQAFGLNREHNGTWLLEDNIYLIDKKRVPKKEIIATKRIGIKKSVGLPWRFYIKDHLYVSKI